MNLFRRSSSFGESSLFVALLIFLLCIQLEQRALFREFALPALPASRALSDTPPPPPLAFFRRVRLNQCHSCYHRCVRGVPDPDALAPAASPHGRAGSSNPATPPEKDLLIAIQGSLSHRKMPRPLSAHRKLGIQEIRDGEDR